MRLEKEDMGEDNTRIHQLGIVIYQMQILDGSLSLLYACGGGCVCVCACMCVRMYVTYTHTVELSEKS
jgi:hypothetical protein